ncbi:MAG: EAL domain-containing protein [Marinobacter sp.]|nr:EAL domain-containing protein [Marinobacter sp.]
MRLLSRLGFRGRLVTAMLALIVVTLAGITVPILLFLLGQEKDRAADRLTVASEVAKEVIQTRQDLLFSNLDVLVQDFGFRSAIASGDSTTINDALANHLARTGADLALLTHADGRRLASVGVSTDASAPNLELLLVQAQTEGFASDILLWHNRAYLTLMIPVQSAGLRAWLTAGFALDNELAGFIRNLTGTEVVFRLARDDSWQAQASSLRDTGLPDEVLQARFTPGEAQALEFPTHFARILPLASDHGFDALLLSDRAEALRSYHLLAMQAGAFAFAAMLIAGLLALATARAFGRPVQQLAKYAAAIGNNPAAPMPGLHTGGELNKLARALADMQGRIHGRERLLRHAARHDELTGLPNRRALDHVLNHWLKEGQAGVVLGMSLTDFKAINETLGFAFGDEALVVAALRMRGQLPANMLLARTGGNQFTALLPAMDEDALQELVATLRGHVEARASILDTPVYLHLTVASLHLPRDASSVDEVRRRIKLTLELAAMHDTHTAQYQAGGDEDHLRELTLIRDLQRGLQEGQMAMVYQPKVNMANAGLIQVEALIRWQHPELGFVNPEEFIRLAESSRQIQMLTSFILHQIAEDMQWWHQQGLDIGVAINLSALDLTNHSLSNEIATVFQQWQGELGQLTFEITESAVMSDAAGALITLQKLQALGVKLSVDDYGTGYSSLAQLRHLPVQELKIDKSFVLQLDSQPQDQLIVRSTIDMAHGLGLSVVAEGIENEASWRLLQAWGCEKGQGYFLGRPMKPEDLVRWAAEFKQRQAALRPDPSPHKQRSLG